MIENKYIQLAEQIDNYNSVGVSYLLDRYEDIDIFHMLENGDLYKINNLERTRYTTLFRVSLIKLYEECGAIERAIDVKKNILKYEYKIEQLVKIIKMLLNYWGDRPYTSDVLWLIEEKRISPISSVKISPVTIRFNNIMLNIFDDKKYTRLLLKI